MPRSIDEIDPAKPIELTNYRHNLDHPALEYIENCASIKLTPEEGVRFFGWVKQTRWLAWIEDDLQCMAEDAATGEPFLTAHIPLVCFREELCSGGRHLQDAQTAAVLTKLRDLTRGWRELGGDTVSMDGYMRTMPQPTTENAIEAPEIRRDAVTLTIDQIKDLAEMAGLQVAGEITDDDRETEITVETCSAKGVDDDGTTRHYRHVAYYEEYIDEGVTPLGPEIPPH